MPNPRVIGVTQSSAGKPMIPFGIWLSTEIAKRGQSDNAFAVDHGLHRRDINRWLYLTPPKAEYCAKIAEALEIPYWRVLEAAGRPFDGLKGLPESRRAIVTLIERLSDDDLLELETWLTSHLDAT